MSLKNKLTELLFGSKPEAAKEEESLQEQGHTPETVSEPPSGGIADPAVLDLPEEHPVYQLYNLRRKEKGYLSLPRICLDEDGVLPEEVVQQERNRLRTALLSMSAARLKEVRGKKKKGGKAEKKKERDEKFKERIIKNKKVSLIDRIFG